MRALSDMDIKELEKLLTQLKENLEEVEEERAFVLRQTGYHLPGATAKKYEAEVNSLKSKIEEVEKILCIKKAEI